MASVWIPSLLRPLTGGVATVDIPGTTLGDVIDELGRRYPGMRERLILDGEPRADLAFAIDGTAMGRTLDTPIGETSELHILPAISGG